VNSQRRAIIAVFGSKDRSSVSFAEEIGRAIAQRKQILLTGGGGGSKSRSSVKENAIIGVGKSPWIGVVQGAKEPKCISITGQYVVIHTNLGDRRNYVEACLSDASVGLEGKAGTVSEIAFSLWMKRPVALVGRRWEQRLSKASLSDMVEEAWTRVGEPSGNTTLDRRLIKETLLQDLLGGLADHRYRHFEPPDDIHRAEEIANAIVDWLLDALEQSEDAGRRGHFPELDGYGEVAACYRAWLDAL
jgi:predicted Rossmann-fold nucleotide-binding protein